MWDTIHLVATCLVLPLFLAQFVCWIMLRLRRLTLTRWRKLGTTWFLLGLSYLVGGGALLLLGPPEGAQTAFLGITGGLFNALVAAFHLKTVDLVVRTIQRTPRKPAAKKDEESANGEAKES